MRVLGGRVVRREDPKLITEGGTYVADVPDGRLDRAVWLTFVRSTVAHGLVRGIETADAAAVPGVLGVFTAADLAEGADALAASVLPPPLPNLPAALGQPPLARDRVRYVGEAMAVVAATHPGIGADAAELVVVDVAPCPPVVATADAATDAVLVHPDVGTNTAAVYELGAEEATVADELARCAVVVELRLEIPRVAPCPLEGRSCASAWDADGRLHHWTAVQAPHAAKGVLGLVLGLAPELVHVIAPDVGGGFGAKFGAVPEDVVTAWVARRLRRPARWTETRSESMVGLAHGRGQSHRITVGGDADGRLRAYRLEILQDCGAYASLGAYTSSPTTRMAAGPYAIPTVRASARAVTTNTAPVSAYRGAGRPEAAWAMERAVDRFAAAAGLDPIAVRRANLLAPEDFPHETPVGTTYDTGDYVRALDAVVAAIDLPALRTDQAARRANGDHRLLGIGICAYVESTAGPYPGSEHGRVVVGPDGAVTAYTGTSPHGQGHDTSWAMIVAEVTGIPVDRVTVVHGDTDRVPVGMGTFGSRSLQLGGAAVHGAALEVVEQARRLAADHLEARLDDVVLDAAAGAFHVTGTPTRSRSWAELAADGPLDASHVFTATAPTYPFGAHASVVEVDRETGAVRLLRHVSVDDAGCVLNPVVVEGQRHGGIAQGVAEVLLEEFRFDADGNPLTTNLADYPAVSAAELPSFELLDMETPTPVNPLGAKGIGEAGTIGAMPAVHAAVLDALAHLGVTDLDPPTTPEKIWRELLIRGG